ncbi:hypothetical protein FRACYDRAFT_249343 [Fragilariopsis cylindrus CCMP1102]|uniref:Uncharacterized protein n=1 Tax=Fragilariopsis cylindrus CCMP1102 TaxID=635003 RepID=A0A1E7ET02_9STRA|nr:hypothetical protein FRACYDRAFT_249343 [Fragilariopsis cylindrus CCMP1102]|eukprot:OEU08999.1 hypothetical protein FRACYDRAFT_249343 [Fragilariopsis cylindrus CCMP1102]
MLSSLSSPLRLSVVVPGSRRLLREAAVAQPTRLLSTTTTMTTAPFITTPCSSSRHTITQRKTGQQLRPTIQALSSSFPSLSSRGRYFTSSTTATTGSSSLDPTEIQKRLNEFQDLFVEARMCIDDLKDSVETVYYDDDAEEAKEATDAAINYFETLCSEITDLEEKNKVLRGNGLKVEQLKGELELTLNGGH